MCLVYLNICPPVVCGSDRNLLAFVNGGIWGAVISFERHGKKETVNDEAGTSSTGANMHIKQKGSSKYMVDILINCEKTDASGCLGEFSSLLTLEGSNPRSYRLYSPQNKRGAPSVLSVPLAQVTT